MLLSCLQVVLTANRSSARSIALWYTITFSPQEVPTVLPQDFTLANDRRFYSPTGNPVLVKVLTFSLPLLIAFTLANHRRFCSSTGNPVGVLIYLYRDAYRFYFGYRQTILLVNGDPRGSKGLTASKHCVHINGVSPLTLLVQRCPQGYL